MPTVRLCPYCGKNREFYKTKAKASRCKQCWHDYYVTRSASYSKELLPCKKCGQPGKRLPDGKIRCNECVKKYRRAYDATSKGKKKRRAQHKRYKKSAAGKAARHRYQRRTSSQHALRNRLYIYRKKYQLEPKEFFAMVEHQNGCCAICGDHVGMKLCVDHNHVTGKIRELLCRNCNTGFGVFRESPEILKRAIEYAHRHSSIVVGDTPGGCFDPEVE